MSQIDGLLSPANDLIAILNYKYPRYSKICISSVEIQVQIDINTMSVVADRCQKCSGCSNKGFQTPEFVNNSCSLELNVGGIVTKIFSDASSILASLEKTWVAYRDDANNKINYLSAKAQSCSLTFSTLWQSLTYYASFLAFDIEPIQKALMIVSDFNNYMYNLLGTTYGILENFNEYFKDNTDQLIIKLNQVLNKTIVDNWNRTTCRAGILDRLFFFGSDFTNWWNFYMTSFFYTEKIDLELSALFTEILNFSLYTNSCLSGVDANSSAAVKLLAKTCLNLVSV